MLRTMMSLAVLSLAAAGCQSPADTSHSMQDRQDAALKDPFGYGPSSTSAGAPARPGQTPPTDASGLNQRDDSFKSDWNDFWNP